MRSVLRDARLMALPRLPRPAAGQAHQQPATSPPRLLDRVRAALRTRHYSPRTEKAYVGWIRRFIIFHGKRHPDVLSEQEIAAFLSSLADPGRVSASPRIKHSLRSCSFTRSSLAVSLPGWATWFTPNVRSACLSSSLATSLAPFSPN
jgi:hypothetical protein